MRHERRAAHALVPLALEEAQEHLADVIPAERFLICVLRRHAFLILFINNPFELWQTPISAAIVGFPQTASAIHRRGTIHRALFAIAPTQKRARCIVPLLEPLRRFLIFRIRFSFGVLFVPFPAHGIFQDVSARAGIFLSVAQHALKIIALPDFSFPSKRLLCRPCYCCFECSDNCRDGTSHWLLESLRRMRLHRRGHDVSCPYGCFTITFPRVERNNAVQMVWHHHEFLQRRLREMLWYLHPALPDNFPKRAKHGASRFDPPKDLLSSRRTNRQEVSSRLGIVCSYQPYRSSVKGFLVRHDPATSDRSRS